ncbi:hypothetical protein MBLNU230_g5114t1 [Neophaeotheca triangularis]
MRYKQGRRAKAPLIVDEDTGIPTELYETCQGHGDQGGLLSPSDPRTLLLSMSGYDKPQNYDVYDYNQATRPEQAPSYSHYTAHYPYAAEYGGMHAQVPSGLPQSTALSLIPSGQEYGTHDPTYYNDQHVRYPAYLEAAPRQLPEIISYSPNQGQPGSKVTVHFRSIYDLDHPHVNVMIMFGHKRCDSRLSQSSTRHGQTYEYEITADVPPFVTTNSPSPQVPMYLTLDEPPASISWESPSLEFGAFTYLDFYPLDSPQQPPPSKAQRKRKLTPDATERSPVKKQSIQNLGGYGRDPSQQPYTPSNLQYEIPASPFSRSVHPEAYSQSRRFSGPEHLQSYNQTLPRAQTSYQPQQSQTTPRLHVAQSPASYSYYNGMQSATRSPSGAPAAPANRSTQLLPSPAAAGNPPLVRTSALQQPPESAASSSMQTFNPYAIYPPNAKASLKIEGDLNSMAEGWSHAEWEARRRLVQFRRSQTGSVINASFEAVSLEDRLPNSICVSCIWWEEKQESYVTSVDTIALLESLVAVRFTVEEKNRIRRNLEGFRPATVSKTKPDSEEFFKLIMGFPNPKPRNIEKDVKVFPWRILAVALKKIIGKYSASYSSTAGALHGPATSAYSATGRASDAGMEQHHQSQRRAVSPRSTSSSAPSHGHAYPPSMSTHVYSPHAPIGSAGVGLGLGPQPSAGPPELRLAVPGAVSDSTGQTTSWHQPSTHYSNDLSASASAARGSSWDFAAYMPINTPISGAGLPGSTQYAQQYPTSRVPSLSSATALPSDGRFAPLHDYDETGQQTSSA